MLREFACELSVPLRQRSDGRPARRPCNATIPIPRARSAPGRASFLDPGETTNTQELLVRITRAIKQQFRYRRARDPRHPGADRDAAAGQRHLPRLRAADDRGGALARPRGALRHRLSVRPGAGRRRRRPDRRRRDPRLGPGLSAGRRLDRVRPDQRPGRRPQPDPGRRRARPQAGDPAPGQLPRRGRPTSSRWQVEVKVTQGGIERRDDRPVGFPAVVDRA